MHARAVRLVVVLAGLCAVANFCLPAEAALDPAQKKELAAIRTELIHVKIPIRRELIDEAETKTADAEQRLDALVKEAGLDKDAALVPIRKLIANRRKAIAKAREKQEKDALKKDMPFPAPGSKPAGAAPKKRVEARKAGEKGTGFVAQIAPIFVQHCLDCHGAERKGGLRLDTFAGMERGGKDGPLLVIGDAENSLVIGRLTCTDDRRMPKGAPPLAETEIRKIAEWINRGAKFDGSDKSTPLSKLAAPVGRSKGLVKIVVARPNGTETVSFTKNVAPFMVERCLRCHSGNEPKGGLSLETFADLLAGGKSGPVIEPGNLDKSRIWDLVGKQKPFKMPPGDARITRRHWNSLQTWILEGAKYDGDDPKRPLRSLVPSESERRNAELARMTPQELRDKRQKRSEDLWRRALPKESPQHVENDAFLLYGNVPSERLEQAARWAADGLQAVQAFFDDRSAPVFKGGLAIYVLKDRFSYEEFAQVIEKREPQAAIHGHAVVTPNLEDAYVAVQDLADAPVGDLPGARANLTEHLAAAYLMRAEKKLPDWLVLGSGRVVTAGMPAASAAKAEWPQIYRLAGSVEKPDDIFTDGTFSPTAATQVGAAIVSYLLEGRGKPLFVRFVKSVRGGTAQADAFRDVYGAEPRALAESFLARAAETAKRASN